MYIHMVFNYWNYMYVLGVFSFRIVAWSCNSKKFKILFCNEFSDIFLTPLKLLLLHIKLTIVCKHFKLEHMVFCQAVFFSILCLFRKIYLWNFDNKMLSYKIEFFYLRGCFLYMILVYFCKILDIKHDTIFFNNNKSFSKVCLFFNGQREFKQFLKNFIVRFDENIVLIEFTNEICGKLILFKGELWHLLLTYNLTRN